MASTPIQYDLTTGDGNSSTYACTPGPAQAAAAGDYKKNTPGLRQIRFILKDFQRPTVQQPRWP